MKRDAYGAFEMELAELKAENSYRDLKNIQARRGKRLTYRDKEFLNLSSNDYLGLSSDEDLLREFYHELTGENILSRYALGSSSSRLLTGNNTPYAELEKTIAHMYRDVSSPRTGPALDALIFTNGYSANTGVIPALAGKGDLIVSDRLNHASIIDGVRLSGAECIVCRHLDYGHMSEILETRRHSHKKALIVSESLFSMDGDIADLNKLVEIKERFGALLYVDEAHAFGVYGESGLGICEREGVIGRVDVIMGTFGKALGSFGAFTVSAPVIKEYLVNKARPFIFTTALPPVVLNWNLCAIRKMPLFREKRERLSDTSRRFRSSLTGSGLTVLGEGHIIPVIFGDNERSIRAAELLQERGYLVFPIRPPTVPAGSSRIRISLRADILMEDVAGVPDIVRALN